MPSVVSFIILIFLIISYFWFYIWRLNIKHCHQKSLVWWKKCEIPKNYSIFLHFLGGKFAFTSNATYILLYLTSRSTVKHLKSCPFFHTKAMKSKCGQLNEILEGLVFKNFTLLDIKKFSYLLTFSLHVSHIISPEIESTNLRSKTSKKS